MAGFHNTRASLAIVLMMIIFQVVVSAFGVGSLFSLSPSSSCQQQQASLSSRRITTTTQRQIIKKTSRRIGRGKSSSSRLVVLFNDAGGAADEDSTTTTTTSTNTGADDDKTTTSTATTAEVIRTEANLALNNVGWSVPDGGDDAASSGAAAAAVVGDGSLTSDDAFVRTIDAGIRRDVGVSLDELLNPAKVVNLERDLYNLRIRLAEATNKDLVGAASSATTNGEDGDTTTTTTTSLQLLSTDECDGGGGGDIADQIRRDIDKKENDLFIERRSVFRGWLKNIFLIQAVVSFILSYIMATDPAILFGNFGWYSSVYNMDVSIQVLGYWWWWLFIIPSLRSRRPSGQEKQALDIAFISSPFISIIAPIATKDTSIIWFANLIVVSSCYAYSYLLPGDDDDDKADDNDGGSSSQPAWLKFIYKSLDFGSGRERGARN